MERIKDLLILLLEGLLGILLLIMSAVTAAQVFCRYALGFSLPWSHELVILILIWAVWLSIPVGIDRVEHLSVTFLFNPDSTIRGFRLIWVYLFLSLSFFTLIFVLSFPVVEAFEGMSLLSVPLPVNFRYYAATVGSFITIFVLVSKIVKQVREG